MQEKDIFDWIQYDSHRKVVEAIETTAKSAQEIALLTGIAIRKTREYLERLKRVGAVEYTYKGWKATELAIKVLDKYF